MSRGVLTLMIMGGDCEELVEVLQKDYEDSLPDCQQGTESSADAPLGRRPAYRLAYLDVFADAAIQSGYR